MSAEIQETTEERRARKRQARLRERDEEPAESRPPPVVGGPLPDVLDAQPSPVPVEEGDSEEEVIPAAPASGKRGPALSAPLRDMRNREDLSLKEMLEGLGESAAFKITLTRTSPENFRGKKVGGILAHYKQVIDEEFIKEKHGGGIFTVKVLKRNERGSYVYFTQRSVDVAGDPRTDELSHDDGGGIAPRGPSAADVAAAQASATAKAEAPLLTRAFDILAERGQDRGKGIDPTIIESAVAPYRLMIEQSKSELAALRAELRELRDAARQPPAADTFKDQMLGSMMQNESARLTTLRAQHESELRQLKESHREDEKRIYDRTDREKSDLRSQHEREVNALRQGFELQISTLKQFHDTQKTLHDAEVRRLERDITEMRVELKELRGRKDQTLLDKAKELKAVKDAISDDDGKDEKSTASQILGVVMESPLVGKVVDKLTAAAASSEPAQPQLPPVGVPFQGPDGKTYMRMPNGQIRALGQPGLPQRRPQRPRAAPPAQAAEAGPAQTDLATELNLSPIEVKAAVQYLESAWNSQQDPALVAQSVRSMIPESILRVLRERGVDVFLDQVAQLDSASPLAQQSGRSYARKVAKVLLDGGVVDE